MERASDGTIARPTFEGSRARAPRRAPTPHTPVTLFSAAHSGSALPTPTLDANGPAGIVRDARGCLAVRLAVRCACGVRRQPLFSRSRSRAERTFERLFKPA